MPRLDVHPVWERMHKNGVRRFVRKVQRIFQSVEIPRMKSICTFQIRLWPSWHLVGAAIIHCLLSITVRMRWTKPLDCKTHRIMVDGSHHFAQPQRDPLEDASVGNTRGKLPKNMGKVRVYQVSLPSCDFRHQGVLLQIRVVRTPAKLVCCNRRCPTSQDLDQHISPMSH